MSGEEDADAIEDGEAKVCVKYQEYADGGKCLIPAVNNALGRHVVEHQDVEEHFEQIPKWMNGKEWDGYRFDLFQRFIKNKYNIHLTKVKKMNNRDSYVVSYKVNNYIHAITYRQGTVLDNRKDYETTNLPPKHRIFDIYKVEMS